MLESFRDFVRLCLDKREDDEYPAVAKQLVFFCTGNTEPYHGTISWRVVKDVVGRRPSAQERMFVFRAWDRGTQTCIWWKRQPERSKAHGNDAEAKEGDEKPLVLEESSTVRQRTLILELHKERLLRG
ncbi:hypothetical protein SELMODRAFT_418897 [Selaginella moellendorffii]|uniref:Uncharacterized protein n=1 Tax=Selaginella moellendorffii TaxID=88036 RepID=D8S759_SELML|nr:hypothetical protein SELMODRAFT_418897 [Selaginella moellendorffii]